ncbi:MAG TPA: hypothetical protein VHO71_04805 [Caproiciproducens sp.]|nr:hypothetical protein [Caproiciproducens sp.]
MNQVEIVCIIIAAVGAIFGVCGIVFPKLTKKGVDTNAILGKVDSGLEVAGKAVDAIKAIAPDTPYISTAEAIIEFADQGVRQAEQLYISNQISADARKTEAVQLTKDLLTAAGVTITPQIETIINGCVEAATFTLPQTHMASDSQASSSAPAASDTPAASSTHTVSDSTAASSAPAVSDSTAASSAPAVSDAPAASSAPAVSDTTAASSAPAMSDTPAASSAPAVSNTTAANGTTVASNFSVAGTVTVDQINQAIATLSAVKAEKAAAQPTSSESGAVAPDTTGAV